MTTKPIKTLLARALYNNQSEFPTELAFSRGDVVTVLERDPEGFEGWWICNRNGKIGIAPGNRFEILGSVVKPKSHLNTTSDVYDDPREWTVPDPITRVQQSIPSAVLEGCGTYENLESHKPCHNNTTTSNNNRTSGLTDSGNYSNRSSDVSLSLQSMTGATLSGSSETKIQRKTPDSQFEDYEDLDFYSNQHYKLDIDWSSRALPPIPRNATNSPRSSSSSTNRTSCDRTVSNQPIGTQNGWDKCKPNLKNSVSKEVSNKLLPAKCTPSTYSDPQTRLVSDLEEGTSLASSMSVDSMNDTEILRSGFLKDQQDILAALRSRSAFVQFLAPLKQRIESRSQRVLSSIGANRSGEVPDTATCTYNLALVIKDLTMIQQTCGLLTASSKESPDAGLMRKFLLLRKATDDCAAQLGNIIRHLELKTCTSDKQVPSIVEVPRLVQVIEHTVDTLETTVLANAPLLFSPTKMLRRTSSSSRSNLPENNIVTTRALSNSVPQLNKLDKTDELEELRSLGPKQFKTFQNGIKLLKQHCESSNNAAQQFLDVLKAHDWSPNLQRYPKPALTPRALTQQVKNTLHQSSLLVRAIAEFCSTVCGVESSNGVKGPDGCLRRIALELENRGSAICEVLKGLVIQTKEATGYLRNDMPLQSVQRLTFATLPIPGPLWQRLLGSTRSVCMSLTAVDKILSSYIVPETE